MGLQQSPIDVREVIRAQLAPLRFIWDKRAETIVNNGHTIQLNMGETSVLGYGSANYRLVQFHFHHPSEHLVAGKSFPMEVHFVHANAAGSLAVVGVLMAAGRANAVFNKIVSTMPEKGGPAVAADRAINPNALLPGGSRSYYRYEGSLTTPPCSETVDWLLLADPIGGRCRYRALRKSLSNECAAGTEGKPSFCAALGVAGWGFRISSLIAFPLGHRSPSLRSAGSLPLRGRDTHSLSQLLRGARVER